MPEALAPSEFSKLTAANAPPPRSHLHLPALDGIRGLAVLLVLFYHFLWSNEALTNSRLVNAVMVARTAGWIGVDLFFVLSGFLITQILHETVDKPGYFRNFYARRFLRIFPLYYGALLILLVFTAPLGIHWDGGQFALLAYLQTAPHWIGRFHPTVDSYAGHFWSLAVEEQFYLVWPLIVYSVRNVRRLMMAALLLAAAALALRIFAVSRGFDYDFTYRFTLCRMDSLLIGACLALLMYTPAAPAARRIGFGVFAAVLAVTLFTSFFLHSESFDPSRSWFFNSVGYSLIALAFAGLVASALDPRSWTNTAFQIPLLRWFGRYSYGLYVIHYIVMGAIGTAPRHYLAERFHSKAVGVVGGAVPAIGATLVLAWLSFRFYESPFLKLKKYFEPTASPPSHIAAVAFPPSPVGEESA